MLHFLDQRNQAKMQLMQDPSQSNVDNLNNVRRETSIHFAGGDEEYLKAKSECICLRVDTYINA